jgi:hypothetical protein
MEPLFRRDIPVEPSCLGQQCDNMSGPHRIFWTYGIAKDPPFRSAGLFDRALDRACAAAQGETDLMEVLRLITNKVKTDITYDPGAEPSGGHPLGLYDYGGSYCAENSQLLRGLFRSIGVDAEVRYIWNGTKGHLEQMYFYRTARTMFAPNGEERGFQVGMAQEDEVPPDPHFKFHAVVDANGTSFDPSYGTSGFASLDFLEAVGVVEPYQLLVGAAANQNQHSRIDSYPPEPALQTGVRCSHSD